MARNHRTCTFCEANCGIVVTVADGAVAAIEPDPKDPLSQGHICAKAFGLRYLQDDPDRLRTPMLRDGDEWHPIGWEEAFDLVGRRFVGIQRRHGYDAVATFLGNAVGQNFGTGCFTQLYSIMLGSRNHYTSCSLDQNPMHAAALSLFGNVAALPVPDLERTECLVVFGANPAVSNGSLMTAPGFGLRAQQLRARGGRIFVVDPRRTPTAELADRHLAIIPGTDAVLLAWLVAEVLEQAPERLHPRADGRGLDALRAAVAPFRRIDVAARTGITGEDLEALRDALLATERAAVYGRIGISHQRESALASWLLLVLNVVLGTLDRPGGMMFTSPAIDLARFAKPLGRTGGRARWRSAARGILEFNGELPAAIFPEEVLDAPEPKRIRGLLTVGANPARSAPDSARWEEALRALEFHVAIDFYLNETTRHAHLVLPPTTPLEQSNYPGIPYALAVRNVAKYSAPALTPPPEGRADWEILNGLLAAIRRRRDGPLGMLSGPALHALNRVTSPDTILDIALRVGGRRLSIKKLRAEPSGIDLGPLQPRLDKVLWERSAGIHLDDEMFLERLHALGGPTDRLVLIGRRHPRSNNTWFHRYPKCAAGKRRTDLEIHPDDAAPRGITDGAGVELRRGERAVLANAHVTDAVRRGVVCLPHGWGDTNYNALTEPVEIDPICGNAVFTGLEVDVALAQDDVRE